MERQQDQAPRKGRIAIHVALQLAALAGLLGTANYFAFQNPMRWDVSRDTGADLAPQTRSFLKRLDENVKIHVLFQSANLLLPDTHNLLKEYHHHARRKLEVNYVDPGAEYETALDLKKRFEFELTEDVLIVEAGERHVVIPAARLGEFDLSEVQRGGRPRLAAYVGERVLTSALISLLEDEPPVVYFTYDHLEPEPALDGDLSRLLGLIVRQNIEVRPLLLRDEGTVPDNADAVVVAGPQVDLPARHITALTTYWAQGGRLFIALWNGAQTPRLDTFLATRGVAQGNDQVLTVSRDAMAVTKQRDVAAIPSPDHQATRKLRGLMLVLRGRTTSLTLATPPPTGLQIVPLLSAAEEYWGENDVYGVEAGRIPAFDPLQDAPPPVVVAAAVEQTAPEDERIATSAGRLVVFGNAFALVNPGLTDGVADFVSSTLNWLLDRKDLIGIPPKSTGNFAPNLSEEQLSALLGWLVLVLPGAAALAGVVAWYIRRA